MRVEKVGRYEVLETLARGGMGVVYKARDPLIDRVVAVKTLGFGLSPLEAHAFRQRFAREAKSAGRLSHPNIVTIHDMGESDDGAYIAMEFLEGRSLRDILDSGVVLPPAEVARIATQVADGLAFAHQHDVVHCDIKPGNIMLLDRGSVKITDFGIARLPTGSRTFAGNVLGSPRYISPEQIVGRPVDARSDIFSLGAVLYEMLTGVAPFAGTAIDEILYQVINDKPEPPSSRNKRIPAAFDEIVARAMAKHPDDRYRAVEDMASALRPLAAQDPIGLPELPPIGGKARATAPGKDTVQLDVGVNDPDAVDDADAGREPRVSRKWMLAGVTAALAVLAIGWAQLAPRPSAGTPSIDTAPEASAPNPGPPGQATAERRITLAPTPERVSPAPPTNAARAPAMPVVATAAAAKPLARLGFAVAPWGEIYVDGKRRGVTPPLTELKLAPGKYVVEIRNTTFAPHRETVELKADGALRIRHSFQ